jgi:hypothetical protein
MSEPLEKLKVRIVDTGRECYDREYCVITNRQWVEDRHATYQFVKDVFTESGNL